MKLTKQTIGSIKRWTMNMPQHMLVKTMLPLALCIGLSSSFALAESSVSEKLGQALSGGALLGVSDPTNQGALEIGKADVDVKSGMMRFQIGGTGEEDTAELPPGTLVQGILVCNTSAGIEATVVSTPPVPVQEDGTAYFVGNFSFPAECQNSEDLGFMIQVLTPGTDV